MIKVLLISAILMLQGCGMKQKFSCDIDDKSKTVQEFKDSCVESPQFMFYWSF